MASENSGTSAGPAMIKMRQPIHQDHRNLGAASSRCPNWFRPLMRMPARTRTGILGVLTMIAIGVHAQANAPPPRTFYLSRPALVAARANLTRGDTQLKPALTGLLADAEQAMKLKPASVMDKPLTAASGDKHDYFSYGPYWWPDPAKPGGLPYIRRDGERNPASLKDTDDAAFSCLGPSIETLGLAYWFTGEERYALKAAQLVRVWFLDPATRMNPNFQHAQAIPGVTDGRGHWHHRGSQACRRQ